MANSPQLTASQAQNATVAAAQKYGVDPTLALQILQQESSGGTNAGTSYNNNGSYDTGPFQLNSNNFVGPGGTFQVTSGPGAGNYDPNDPIQNIDGGVAYFAQMQAMFPGDTTAALAAYNNGPTAVTNAMNTYGDDYLAHLPNGNYPTQVQAQLAPPTNQNGVNLSQNNPTISDSTTNPAYDVLNYTVAPYQNVSLTPVSQETLNATEPPTVIMQGLSEIPWYNNPSEITGNPKIHAIGYPVTFKIIMDRNTGATLNTGGTSTGDPISIRLNASMKSYNLQSSHIINKSPSRTGMHLTFWGMNADAISGECNTGTFMNQFGLTSFLNMAYIPSDVQNRLKGIFSGDPSLLSEIEQRTDPFELRIAAQDAFVEFLSLFKNNGVTWYHPQDYSTGTTPDKATALITGTQTNQGQSAFSAKTGLNTYEMKGRNNDVYTRGYIVMNFRSSSYLGFFRSLSWAMDADKPFSWNFNFIFQIERTLSLLYYPYPG
jgi:hypothetical protein